MPTSGLPVALEVLDAMDQAVCVADARAPDMPLVYVNAAFEATTGYRQAAVLGRNCRFLQGPYTDQPALQEVRDALRESRHARVVLRNVRADGTEFDNELNLSPVVLDGVVTHVVAVQRDVTVREEARARGDRLQAGGVVVARELQRALLPRELPEVAGLDLAARHVPGRLEGEPHLQVSGDFYDVLPRREEQGALLAVGDVAGRGAGAAAYTGQARWGLRALSAGDHDPAALGRRLNQALAGEMGERFLTLALADAAVGHAGAVDVRLALAGHPPAVLRRAGGETSLLGEPGMLLGAFEDVDLPLAEVRLQPDDVLLLYSDGVSEAGGSEDLFGERRLLDVVATAGPDAADVVDAVLDAVARHGEEHGPPGTAADDTTVLAVRAVPQA